MHPAAVFGLFALPTVPLLAHAGRVPAGEDGLGLLALGGLGLAALLRARDPAAAARPGPPCPAPPARPAPAPCAALLPGLVAAGLVLVWGSFFVMDLHRARFAWTLLLVPVGALLGGRRHAGLGALLALTALWALLLRRADNGCTGVSEWYGRVLLLHPVLAMWPAPLLFARGSRGVHES